MNDKQLETLAGELNLEFDPEDRDQFIIDLADYIEQEYYNRMFKRDASPLIRATEAHHWAGDYALLIVQSERFTISEEVNEGIEEGVASDCDDAEEIIRGGQLEELYNRFRDDGEEGFREWCKAELGEEEPDYAAYYCMTRRDNIDKRLPLNSVALGDRRVWLHPRYQ